METITIHNGVEMPGPGNHTPQDGIEFWGQSFITEPNGQVLHRASIEKEEVLKLPKDFVLELLGIDISATRMKCAMLGLKIVKSAALGQPAEWEDEGETGSPAEAAAL